MEPKIMAMYERIRPFVLMDPYKKNDIERFDREPDVICEYIKNRSQYLKDHLSILWMRENGYSRKKRQLGYWISSTNKCDTYICSMFIIYV